MAFEGLVDELKLFLKSEVNDFLEDNNIKLSEVFDGDLRSGSEIEPQFITDEKFRRLSGDYFLQPGDVIGIMRGIIPGLYEHYGIYIGNGRVIHYAGEGDDFGENITIHEAPLSEFTRGDEKQCFVVYFPENGKEPRKIMYDSNCVTDRKINIPEDVKGKVKINSPEETILRAKSRIGEKKYNLVDNNCEHFAMWAKLGVSFSVQVKETMDSVEKITDEIEKMMNS